MEVQVNVNSIKDAFSILAYVQQAINEHKKMQQSVESYLGQNGAKKEYEHFAEKRIENMKETRTDISKMGNSLKKDEKNKKKKNSKNQKYNEWQAQQKHGKRKKLELVKEDIQECLDIAKSQQEFDFEMQKRGYEVHRKGKTGNALKYTSVLPPGWKRGRRLGEEQEKMLKALPERAKEQAKRKQKAQQAHQTVKTKHEEKNATENDIAESPDIKNEHNIQTRIGMDGMDTEKNEKQKKKPFIFIDNLGQKEENSQKKHSAPFIKSAKIKPVEENKADFLTVAAGEAYIPVLRKQSVWIVKTMTAAFILDDYGKRRRGKYYREYVKFDAIQKKVKYLHGNHINTMGQLEKKMAELYSLQEKLAGHKKEIFKERRKYAGVFKMYETLEELRIPVKLYQDGDHTFSREHEQMKETLAKLQKSGMTVREVKAKYSEFMEKLSSMGKIERMLKKEVKLCEEIKQESIQKQMIRKQRQKAYAEEGKKSQRREKTKNKTR